jgi:hypothetical protein
MKTGIAQPLVGLYQSMCCGEELIMGNDDQCPACTKCHASTAWELIEMIGEVTDRIDSKGTG